MRDLANNPALLSELVGMTLIALGLIAIGLVLKL